LEKTKEQQRVGQVEQNVGQVMSTCAAPVELAVECMGQPGQWVPVAGMRAAEGPANVLPGQTGQDMRIRENIGIIVVVEEAVSDRRSEDCQG
jgi:hypothetical protein